MKQVMKVILVWFFTAIGCLGYAQSYNYLQYTTRDGLAGSTVYDLCQDKDGFMWFATNNGISRFDGKNFKNYTVNDGLPDNEVLRIYPDSMGRVWIASFRNEISYYENGKIHNKLNTKELNYDPIFGRVLDIIEMRAGTIWILTSKWLLKYKYGDGISTHLKHEINPSRVKTQLGTGPAWFGEKLPLVFNDSIFYFTDSCLVFYKEYFSFNGQKVLYDIPNQKNDTPSVITSHDIVTVSHRNHKAYFISTISGAVELDTFTLRPIREFLPEKVVTRAMIDQEGGYWLSTLGDGVFKLASTEVQTFRISDKENSWNEVFSISAVDNKIYTGNFNSEMIEWELKGKGKPISFSKYLKVSDNRLATNRLYAILPLPGEGQLLGFDAFLVNWDKKVKGILPVTAIKSIAEDDKDHVLVATGLRVVRVNLKTFKVTDTIWHYRATSAVRFGNAYFIGTLNGLVEMDAISRVVKEPRSHPSLIRRITDLKIAENSLWIATSDSGIVQLTNGMVVNTFSEHNGLGSNNCRVLFPYRQAIWVGTNKGISKIDLKNTKAFPVKYDSYNLLPSDIINAIFVKNDFVYVGSPAGLTAFQEGKLKNFSLCKLIIEQVKTEAGASSLGDTIHLAKNNNEFQVSYTTISIKSSGEVSYFFRMKGLNDEWTKTKGDLIAYSSIPHGNYLFELYAVNKFGEVSETRRIHVVVPFPLYKKPFFWVSLFLLAVVLSFFGFKLRERQFRRIMESKDRMEKQLALLEQKALQAQMNPHFIFNALNSIQQYILANNVEDANRYLSIFAALIRETLENSSSGKISLNREIAYISKYLELERMRFGNTFEYKFRLNELDSEDKIEIPVMLLQPFVENAVRHGIRYRNGDGGLIEIDFFKQSGVIICHIRDNGPGREARLQIKSKQPIEYQSKGTNLTQRRVDILNLISEEQVFIEVKDVIDEAGQVAGTEVEIKFTHLTNETED